MAQPSRTDRSHQEPGRLDASHHSQPPSSRAHHHELQHAAGASHPQTSHHRAFYHQNGSPNLPELSHVNQASQQNRTHLSTLPSNSPQQAGGSPSESHPRGESQHRGGSRGGSHPHGESQHRGGSRGGSHPHGESQHRGGSRGGPHGHGESHHRGGSRGGPHGRGESHPSGGSRGGPHPQAESLHPGGPRRAYQPQADSLHPGGSQPSDESYLHSEQGRHHPRRPSEALSSFTSIASNAHRDASHHGQPQHGLHATPSGRPHYRKQSFLGDTLPTHSLEEPYQEGPSSQDDAYYDSHQPSHRHGERPHRRDHYRRGERPHHREHIAPNYQSTSQLSVPFKSQTTLGASSSRLGGKSSSYLGPRSFTSRISSKIYPEEDSKESGSWNEEEQIHKRKRAQRGHRKLHSGNVFQLMIDKINFLIWGLREMMLSLTESLFFETFIFIIVCLNTIVLVAQTFTELEIRGEWYFMVLDSIFLAIYIMEALLKLIALGLEYFYDPWNNLDFFIMIMAILDFALLQINSLSYSFYNHSLFRILKVFKSMRALRAIRVLRRLSILTSLHEVTGTLRGSLMSITAILFLMFTCLFLFSVVLRALFGKSDPKRFQNIFTTLFTLFTMLTLDDWSLIYMDNRAEGAWYIIPILMIYIVIQYFIFLNLVIAVLVDSFQMALLKGLEKVKMEKAARIHEKLLDDSLTDLNQAICLGVLLTIALSLHADPEAKLSVGTLKMQLIEKMFGTMTESQRENHFQYLQLVAAVEQHQQKFRSQASVIDEIVDTTFEAAEDEFGK